MRKIKILFSYNGTKLNGWEGDGLNSSSRFIKLILQQAFFKFSQEEVKFFCAGRTDAGVHAIENCCHFSTHTNRSIESIKNGMNFSLPKDIVIHHVEEVDEAFHARFSAKKRHYKYFLSHNPSPLFESLHVKRSFDLDSMQESLDYIKQMKDFSVFAPSSVVDAHKRTIEEAYIEKEKFLSHNLYSINVVAKAFFHHQVRRIVGNVLNVATKKWSVDEFKARSLEKKFMTYMAPARGLYLYKVFY